MQTESSLAADKPFSVEPLNLPGEQLPNTHRHLCGDNVHRPLQDPAPLHLGDYTPVQQIVYHRGHKERTPFRIAVEGFRQPRR